MAYRLKKREPAGRAARRALADDLAAARAMLGGQDLPFETRIHKVRRRLKRDRSLLRVFEPVAPDLARRLRMLLRDAGRELAGLRESHALASAAEQVSESLEAPEGAIVLAAAAPAQTRNGRSEGALDAAATLIAEAGDLIDQLPAGGGKGLFNDALKRAHRKAGRDYGRAMRTRATEDLHEWRKRLKDLAHLTRFGGSQLTRARKTAAAARRAEELLGDDHDLAVLRDRVVKQGRTAASRFVSNVEIGGRRAKLQAKAFALGAAIAGARAPRLR